MNLLFVFYVPSGGVETLNRQRSLALKEMNIHCHFLYYRKVRESINDHNAPTFITNSDLEIKQILNSGNYSAVNIVSDYKALLRFRNLGYTGQLILEIQGFGPMQTARQELTKAVPYVTGYANALLNPKTPHIDQLFNELFPAFPKFSFNNCFDTSQFCYRSLPINGSPIIAWCGRIEDNKNWREFLQIGYQLIHTHNPNIELYMFEDPSLSTSQERAQFYQLIKQLNLEKNLTILANIPNDKMADYYSIIGDSGGFLCSTSKVEGAPLSILEAMSCRCPVLTTDSDGVRSSIYHNQTGKYYPLGNISEAANQAIELLTNHTLREYIRSTAFIHLTSNFSPEQYRQHFKGMLTALGM